MPVDVVTQPAARGQIDQAMRTLVARRLRAALAYLGRRRSSVTLVFTDDVEIRQLNRDFRNMDRATDVLSFHMQELENEADPAGDGIFLGDIVISIETARRRSGNARLSSELQRLALHGLCHLFGHDHKRKKQADVMYALERRLRRAPLMGSKPGSKPGAKVEAKPKV